MTERGALYRNAANCRNRACFAKLLSNLSLITNEESPRKLNSELTERTTFNNRNSFLRNRNDQNRWATVIPRSKYHHGIRL